MTSEAGVEWQGVHTASVGTVTAELQTGEIVWGQARTRRSCVMVSHVITITGVGEMARQRSANDHGRVDPDTAAAVGWEPTPVMVGIDAFTSHARLTPCLDTLMMRYEVIVHGYAAEDHEDDTPHT